MTDEEQRSYQNIVLQGIAVVFEKFGFLGGSIVISRNNRQPEFIMNNFFEGAVGVEPAF